MNHLDEGWLRAKYEGDKMTSTEIAVLVGRSPETIVHHLRKFGIKTRGTRSPRAQYKDYAWLRAEYESGKTGTEIGASCGANAATISYHMKKAGIPVRKRAVLIDGDKKSCKLCSKKLPLEQFYAKKSSADGYDNHCKPCRKARNAKQSSAYRMQPEVKKRTATTAAAWAEDNPERRRAHGTKRRKKIRHTLKYRIPNCMASSVWHALRHRKAGRRWESLVGYGLEELIEHIERQFEPWMTWDNWGLAPKRGATRTWQIDHIRPVSDFDFNCENSDDVVRECWALANLQPLDSIDNIRKGGRNRRR